MIADIHILSGIYFIFMYIIETISKFSWIIQSIAKKKKKYVIAKIMGFFFYYK